MEVLIQTIIDGVCLGLIYSLGALGLVILFKSSGIVNIGQGMIMMVGAFVVLSFDNLHMPMSISLIIALAVLALLAVLVQILVINPLVGQSILAQLVATIGLLYILRGVTVMIWGGEVYNYAADIIPIGDLTFGHYKVCSSYLNGLIITIIAGVLLIAYYRYSKQGIAMRAISEDEQLAESVGIRARKILSLSWALSGAIGALSGCLFGVMGSISYNMGDIGLNAIMPVALFGGLESIGGALLAGPIVGIASLVAGVYLEDIAAGITAIVPLVLMLVVLIFMPYGLFGQKRIERI